jgi:hypothetical protein
LLTDIAWRDTLGHIIKLETAGKERLRLQKEIVIAIKELAKQTGADQTTKDLVAYIAVTLQAIGKTVDESVAAWEKRGYWIKAERYRIEWDWATKLGEDLHRSLLEGDWIKIVEIIGKATQKMSKIRIPQRNRYGTPWVGSWDKLVNPK